MGGDKWRDRWRDRWGDKWRDKQRHRLSVEGGAMSAEEVSYIGSRSLYLRNSVP
jgi:hypothetical protein